MLINFLSLLKGYKQENAPVLEVTANIFFYVINHVPFFFYWNVFYCNSHVIFVVHLFNKGAAHISNLHTHCFMLLLKFWETQKQELTWSKSLKCNVNDLTNLDRPTTQLIFVYVCTYWSRNQNPRLSTLETLKRTTRHSSSRVERLWSRELLGPINLSRIMTRYWLYIYNSTNTHRRWSFT